MNERIKDIAIKSGFIGESMFPVFGTTQETALKRFAELIIQECQNRVEQYICDCGEIGTLPDHILLDSLIGIKE